MNRAGESITRMLPLPKPKLPNFRQSLPRTIPAQVSIGSEQRCDALKYDVGETGETKKIDQREQD